MNKRRHDCRRGSYTDDSTLLANLPRSVFQDLELSSRLRMTQLSIIGARLEPDAIRVCHSQPNLMTPALRIVWGSLFPSAP